MYADLRRLAAGAQCAHDLGQHFDDAGKLFDRADISEGIFGDFPLARECEKKTREVHNVMSCNVQALAHDCIAVYNKAIDMVDQLSQYDNSAAQGMRVSGVSAVVLDSGVHDD